MGSRCIAARYDGSSRRSLDRLSNRLTKIVTAARAIQTPENRQRLATKADDPGGGWLLISAPF